LRIGSPLAYRPDAFKQTVGLFVNVCPLQVTAEEDDSFLSLARKVQVEFFNTSRNQRYPVRTPIEGRVFNVYFNYQIASFTEFSGMPVEFDLIQTKHFNDTLTLQVRDFNATQSYALDFNFHHDAFNEQQRWESLRHYLNLLEAFVENPYQSVHSARMLSEQEQRQILVEFNRTETPYPTDRFLHQLIEEQARLTPDSMAVIYEDQQLTYSELNRRANHLAHFLRRSGVGPEVYVGVCMERAPEMVISLLGILKAGGAYVPIDPTYPKERVAFMLADARVAVLLTQSKLVDQLAESGSRIVCLDTDWQIVAGEPQTNPRVEIEDDNLAYMIYTSGSTGKPKGVMISHAGIRNRILWAQDRYKLDQNDRVFQKTPFSFDPSVWEFLLPLTAGGSIALAAPGGQRDPGYIVKKIAQTKATMMHIVTPMLRAILLTEDLESCRDLRLIIVGAEQVQFEDQERFYERLPWATLENLYGPTEASIDVTYWKCTRAREGRMVPIGRPIANVKIHILDKQLAAVPVGMNGELHIGGINLMRGYHNQPDLTAEKMVPNPYGERGERLYKSGDLSRYREDGEIEFLGRMDTQIKIRGYRVELGEIEAALARHAAIREAVVISREDKPGQQRLVAYFVPAAGQTVSAGELRVALKQSLPDYMIPAVFMQLDALPLHTNSKLNRKALPAPEEIESESDTAYEAPRSSLERLLADIWMEVLSVDKVGIHDDFFEVGGQSILATQFISRVQQVVPGKVPLQAIFETPTIAGLADFITRSQPEQDEDQKVALAELFAEIQELSEEEVQELLRAEQMESSEEELEPQE
jgi:amino acid adenylation domain-containing protein